MQNATKIKIGIAGIAGLGLAAIVMAIVFAAGGMGGARDSDEPDMPQQYEYGTETASNGMELHYLRTRPSNVELLTVRNNVSAAPYYGINGGFFYEDALLSVAVVNDEPVHGESGHYGSGGSNAKYARGTLVWDGAVDRLSVQIVRQAQEIEVAERTNFWAQGGISMSLGRDEDWRRQAAEEAAPLLDQASLRSAAVYDAEGNLYLVVSATRGTLAAFREAIVERIGVGNLVDGIFLDGDGSSQLRSREKKLAGDGRLVVQMLRLIR
ncbi:hypothetical protein B1A99_11150 [Cohnella sp. CIP 111063]|uniref:hypothetical protein n=1 Tax=unclassified Cohnella TaxID=2636738 RepID=UPI000B8C183E|nr:MULTISPECIES: hypothetical protein [unclassified Cohnella]OXS59185.1 hypothetical protein B1A99_11150 [Cohnella sp. CIP 111063]PRX72193.1 hypothetical protein B0G52_10659 [Cohnella sp. SGD-V74]